MNPFNFITLYNSGNVDFVLFDNFDFILISENDLDIELKNDVFDFILDSFGYVDFVSDNFDNIKIILDNTQYADFILDDIQYIDFILKSDSFFDFEVELPPFDLIIDNFNLIEFVIDSSLSIDENIIGSGLYNSKPDDVTAYCCTYILTEDGCIIMTEDGFKLTYE